MDQIKKCTKGNEIQVLHSGAGYYIGTLDSEDNLPMCRLSQEYWKKRETAQEALNNMNFVDRSYAGEIQFCNEGKGCFGCQEHDDEEVTGSECDACNGRLIWVLDATAGVQVSDDGTTAVVTLVGTCERCGQIVMGFLDGDIFQEVG